MKHRMFGWMMLLFMFGYRGEAAERVSVTIENGIARTEVTMGEDQNASTAYEAVILQNGAGRYKFAPAAQSSPSDRVELKLEIKTAQTIEKIEAPHCAKVTQTEEGSWLVECPSIDPRMIAVDYRLTENPRGRVQLWAYRAAGEETGTFLLSLEPGRAAIDPSARVEFAGDRVIETVQLGDERGLVVIGRYREAGGVRMTVASDAGETYATAIELPETDEDTPELERVWFAAKDGELNETADAAGQRIERERAAQAMRAGFVAWNAQIDLARPMFASPVKTEAASASKGEHDSCGCMMTAIPGMSEKLGEGLDAIELIEKPVEGF